MLTATVLAIFLVPLFFVLVRSGFKRRSGPTKTAGTAPPP
jgi:hypothetical protein